jgi:hypothetical protein
VSGKIREHATQRAHHQPHIHIRKSIFIYGRRHIHIRRTIYNHIHTKSFAYAGAHSHIQKMHTIYKKNITFTYGKSPRKHIHLRLPKVPEPPTSFQSIESSRICLYHHLEDCGTSWTVQKLLEQQLLQTLMQSSPLVSSLNCFLLHHLHHWVPFGQCW